MITRDLLAVMIRTVIRDGLLIHDQWVEPSLGFGATNPRGLHATFWRLRRRRLRARGCSRGTELPAQCPEDA